MGGFIPQATLEQIRAASDIVDVISAVVPLKRAGATFTALCPFHREKTPSFHVNPRKQTFHCFGCHKGGDVFTFLRDYENLDFVEAVKRLAERARIPIEVEKDPRHKEQQFLKDTLLNIHEQITQRWQNCLLNDAAAEPARQYLAERGVSAEAVKVFRLGFAPEAWEDAVNWSKSKGFNLEQMEQSGLVVRKEGSDHFYGRFRKRLMFPICDEQGRVIGFSGRVLPGDDDPRKYVNSPETLLFKKSRVMFGLDKSKRILLEKESAIICEGQLDLIACFMAGVQNVVAPQGTALTQDHTRILKRYVKEVVLCFDSDEAGQKAAVRALDDVLGSGLAVRVATVPAPHDPDSFIKSFGAEAFSELIQKAEPFYDYYLNRLCRMHDPTTDLGQKTIVGAMADAVSKANDPVLLNKYARKTYMRFGLGALKAEELFLKAARSVKPAADHGGPAIEDDRLWRPNTQELWLLKILLLHDDVMETARAYLDPSWVQNPHAREVVLHRLATDEVGGAAQPASFLDKLSDRARVLTTECLAEQREIPKPEQQFKDLLVRLRTAFIDGQSTVLNQRLADPSLPSEEIALVLREMAELRGLKRSPLAPLPE